MERGIQEPPGAETDLNCFQGQMLGAVDMDRLTAAYKTLTLPDASQNSRYGKKSTYTRQEGRGKRWYLFDL